MSVTLTSLRKDSLTTDSKDWRRDQVIKIMSLQSAKIDKAVNRPENGSNISPSPAPSPRKGSNTPITINDSGPVQSKYASDVLHSANTNHSSTLNLSGGFFVNIEDLPIDVTQLTRISRLDLSLNVLNSLPPSIGDMRALRELMLSNNSITSLPPDVSRLTQLEILQMSTNRLAKLPAQLCALARLQVLNVAHNRLTELPPDISALRSLHSLNVSFNKLESLPAEIGFLTRLKSLFLTKNLLKVLPLEISQLCQLEYLYAAENELVALPSESVSRMTSLVEIDLSQNRLSFLPAGLNAIVSTLKKLAIHHNPQIMLSPEITQSPSSILSFLSAKTNKQLAAAKIDALLRLFSSYDHPTVDKLLKSRGTFDEVLKLMLTSPPPAAASTTSAAAPAAGSRLSQTLRSSLSTVSSSSSSAAPPPAALPPAPPSEEVRSPRSSLDPASSLQLNRIDLLSGWTDLGVDEIAEHNLLLQALLANEQFAREFLPVLTRTRSPSTPSSSSSVSSSTDSSLLYYIVLPPNTAIEPLEKSRALFQTHIISVPAGAPQLLLSSASTPASAPAPISSTSSTSLAASASGNLAKPPPPVKFVTLSGVEGELHTNSKSQRFLSLLKTNEKAAVSPEFDPLYNPPPDADDDDVEYYQTENISRETLYYLRSTAVGYTTALNAPPLEIRILLVSSPLTINGKHWELQPKRHRRANSLEKSTAPAPSGSSSSSSSSGGSGGVLHSSMSAASGSPLVVARQGGGGGGSALADQKAKFMRSQSSASLLPHEKALAAAQQTLSFNEKLDHKQARELKNALEAFVKGFLRRPPRPEEQPEAVRSCMATLEACMCALPLWIALNSFEIATDRLELERLLFRRIFKVVFTAEEDAVKDIALRARMRKLSWIEPKHLDIAPALHNNDLWDVAKKALLEIQSFVTPGEKLQCVLNCCRVLVCLLRDAGSAAGADDFLPQLIYVTLKANPPQIHSNLTFIQRFCDPEVLSMENLCFYTHLVFAVSFIEIIEASSLSISPEEFEKRMSEPESTRDEN